MPAVRYGYNGDSHAVGPACGPKGLLNPCPEAIAAPIRPVSQPNPKLLSVFLNLYVWPTTIHPTRRNSAMATIQNSDVRICHHTLRGLLGVRSRKGTREDFESMSTSICSRPATRQQLRRAQ